jgi:HD-GYP domain-containing protein (c-di-GMP phosphodiesterase class II)
MSSEQSHENAPHGICKQCGCSVLDRPYADLGTEVCCESCFLKEKTPPGSVGPEPVPYFLLGEALVAALDTREHQTGLHSKRVACHTLVLARRFTQDPHLLRHIYWGALLHDIGKIGVSDAILLKQGPLTEDEWRQMRRHPEDGHRIIAQVPAMAEAAAIVIAHEERYDGKGYPRGIARNEILSFPKTHSMRFDEALGRSGYAANRS